jgi:site-specific recombinase XerD
LTREKFLSQEEVQKLKDTLLSQMLLAKNKGNVRGVKRYYIFEFMINTGVRVSELCKLKHRDINLTSKTPYIQVVSGKGNKDRIIYVSRKFRKTAQEYLNWKKVIAEPTDGDSPVFISEWKKAYTPRTIQQIMRYYKNSLGIISRCTPHSLRHSFAVYLYETTKDLRLVQKQLGHSNVQTTTIYTDICPERASEQMNSLWSEPKTTVLEKSQKSFFA